MKADTEFRLSRIQAEGWNAARRLPVSDVAVLSDRAVEALNPYSSEFERSRWRTGFDNAVASWQR